MKRFSTNHYWSGHIKAASLRITIQQIDGSQLFDNAGGIAVLGKLSGPKSDPVKPDLSVLNETANIQRVVAIAMRPLVGAVSDQP